MEKIERKKQKRAFQGLAGSAFSSYRPIENAKPVQPQSVQTTQAQPEVEQPTVRRMGRPPKYKGDFRQRNTAAQKTARAKKALQNIDNFIKISEKEKAEQQDRLWQEVVAEHHDRKGRHHGETSGGYGSSEADRSEGFVYGVQQDDLEQPAARRSSAQGWSADKFENRGHRSSETEYSFHRGRFAKTWGTTYAKLKKISRGRRVIIDEDTASEVYACTAKFIRENSEIRQDDLVCRNVCKICQADLLFRWELNNLDHMTKCHSDEFLDLLTDFVTVVDPRKKKGYVIVKVGPGKFFSSWRDDGKPGVVDDRRFAVGIKMEDASVLVERLKEIGYEASIDSTMTRQT